MIRPNNPPSPGRGPKRSRSRASRGKGRSGSKKSCLVLTVAMIALPVLLTALAVKAGA